ncbi:hypothetical protein ABMA57_12400 [Saccharospirillum sp. HFRX-1]|uniref:hypothetical protein n=1 Tax=unclassified Saccharospirillum TaxID=2633430 RepID=UPI003714CAAC
MKIFKEITYSAAIKIVSISIAFFAPMIVVRVYSLSEYGVFNYIMSLLVYISIVQSGVTPSLRNNLARVEDPSDAKDMYISALSQTTILVVILTLIYLIISIFINQLLSVFLFFFVSLLSLYGPVVSTYKDYKDESVSYRLSELFFQLIAFAVFALAASHGMNVFILASIFISYRFIYPLFVSRKDFLVSVYRLFDNGGFRYAVFNVADYTYVLMQSLSVLMVVGINTYAFNLFGSSGFGVYSTYYRFFFFPMQVFSFIAPIIWIRYAQSTSAKTIRSELGLVSSVIFMAFFLWSILMYFFSSDVVALYMGSDNKSPLSILTFCFFYLSFQVSDFLSVRLNAKSIYLPQVYMMALTLLLIGWCWLSGYDFEYFVLVISAIRFLFLFYSSYLAFRR